VLPTKFRFIWPSGFRGEDFFLEINQKQEFPVVAMFVNGLGQNEQSLEWTFHRCFLPVSLHLAEWFQRRRLKCEKLTDDRRRTTDAKWWQKLTLPLARWAKKWYIHKVTDKTEILRLKHRASDNLEFCIITLYDKVSIKKTTNAICFWYHNCWWEND
jgi:hypothetical protein